MAINRKLQITFLTPENKSASTTISYVNSDTSISQLRTYSQGLIQLTDNTFVYAKKIDEEKIS